MLVNRDNLGFLYKYTPYIDNNNYNHTKFYL